MHENRTTRLWTEGCAIVAAYSALWLIPALGDWLPRALDEAFGSAPIAANPSVLDRLALALVKNHMWLLLALSGSNLLAVFICVRARSGLEYTILARLYLLAVLVLGGSIWAAEWRLLQMGAVGQNESMTMGRMWVLLSAPMWWILVTEIRARRVRFDSNRRASTL